MTTQNITHDLTSTNGSQVYSRITSAKDWIKDHICALSVDPPKRLCDSGSGSATSGFASNNGSSNLSSGTISASGSSGSGTSSTTILYEDFESGFGEFNSGGSDATHGNSIKGRKGVVGIQAGNGQQSSFYSNNLVSSNGSYVMYRVIFSFYANNMESNDRFCMDLSTNGGSVWRKKKCWLANTDFKNQQWYDDETVAFETTSDSVIVRFRCVGDDAQDVVFFDTVEVQGQ